MMPPWTLAGSQCPLCRARSAARSGLGANQSSARSFGRRSSPSCGSSSAELLSAGPPGDALRRAAGSRRRPDPAAADTCRSAGTARSAPAAPAREQVRHRLMSPRPDDCRVDVRSVPPCFAQIVQVVHGQRTGVVEKLGIDLGRPHPARVRRRRCGRAQSGSRRNCRRSRPAAAPDRARCGACRAPSRRRRRPTAAAAWAPRRRSQGGRSGSPGSGRPHRRSVASVQPPATKRAMYSASSRAGAAGFRSCANPAPGSAPA